MAHKRPVVLYQPWSPYRGLPLGVLHVASALDPGAVEIVDARVEMAPESRIADLVERALCLGVSVVSGRPVADALSISRMVRKIRPKLPIIWGGPHPSCLPAQCLAGGEVDACVLGAGEGLFRRIADALLTGEPLPSDPCIVRSSLDDGVGTCGGEPVPTRFRVDYGLLDVERYFRYRGRRRLDYCSSRLAASRPDAPVVWGVAVEAVCDEIAELVRHYRLSEILFVDEDFLADAERVVRIAQGFLGQGLSVRWYASASPRRLAAMRDEDLRLLHDAGCARLDVRSPGGGPWPRSQEEGEHVLEAARKLHRAHLGGRFPFVGGVPGEPADRGQELFRLARAVRRIDPALETPFGFHAPYPQTGQAPSAFLPGALAGWSGVNLEDGAGPWTPQPALDWVPRYDFVLRHAFDRRLRGLRRGLLRGLARLRIATGFFRLDVERRVVEWSQRVRRGRPWRPPLGET